MRVKVRNVMTREVKSVTSGASFKDVAEVLIAHGVSAVPVVGDEGRVLGVISEADLLCKEEFKEQYYGEGYQPPLRARLRRGLSKEGPKVRSRARGDTAADLMTTPAVTIGPYASVVSAMRLMAEHGVKRLPVVGKEGRLEGIVSRRDLLQVFVRSDADIAREVREDILAHSLWAKTSDVRATVEQGVVTLFGSMQRRSDARIAVCMVERVHGVVHVIDHITWRQDDTPAWKRR
ncbi:CBS domain-containing protein [Nonomuraea basaltis]|uniref:CBS domain-containing protein n=1 Tax=Nonomuraea basaltis TaxID=2495887 RepID=UPI00110C5AB5|nr:CBS domain-containing protein [Nonomuraea basaltis]TMS00305.1 CBS domain-containing protein [Nonomuraea basaltis]